MKRALLIGIRTYPHISEKFGRPLNGCHNDVELMRERLLERGFDDVRVLVDSLPAVAAAEGEPETVERAGRLLKECACVFCRGDVEHGLPTRAGIRDAVAGLVGRIEEGGDKDVVALYYSGHGSEFSSRKQFAGHDFQTLVPYDSGREPAPNRDILDWEVELWIKRLNESTPYVTLIFDACHSGGVADGRRGGGDAGRAVTEPGEGELAEMLEGGLGVAGGVEELSGRVERSPAGWLRREGRSAIVLAACASRELAGESEFDGRRHGIFTHYLAEQLAAGEETTWAGLFPNVVARVVAKTSTQSPQRDGNGPIFERGEIDLDDASRPKPVPLKKRALVIGIDPYDQWEGEGDERRFPALDTAEADARGVARVLREHQGYERVDVLLNEKATKEAILGRLKLLAAGTQNDPNQAVLVYFAGHGEIDNRGEQFVGCLIPWDAGRDTPDRWLPMREIRDLLVEGGERKLRARHALLVLDCCFAGAFLLDGFRGERLPRRPLYYSEYKRFVEGQAWQLLTSSSFSQQARDRDPENPNHSPFAMAFIEAMSTGRADSTRASGHADNIVTARELHQYIDERLVEKGVRGQTPGFLPLVPTNTGEYIFTVPPFSPTPEPDPELDPAQNPWRGAAAYPPVREIALPSGEIRKADPLHFGRRRAVVDLMRLILEDDDLIVFVEGPSGCGKTSLMRAGVIPLLEDLPAGLVRLRSWAAELGLNHYLASADDLGWVRRKLSEWLEDLPDRGAARSIRVLGAGKELAAHLRQWTEEVSLLDADSLRELARAEAQAASLGLELDQEAVARSWRAHRLGLLDLLDETTTVLAMRFNAWGAPAPTLLDLLAAEPVAGELPSFQAFEVAPGELAAVERDLARSVSTQSVGASRVVVFVDGLETLMELESEARGESLRALDRLRAAPGVKMVAAMREAARTDFVAASKEALRSTADSDGHEGQAWGLTYAVPRPSRAELLEVVEEPARASALIWESRKVVEALVDEILREDNPLAALSLRLHQTFENAWRNRWSRGKEDRLLREDDLPRPGEPGTLVERLRTLKSDPEAPGAGALESAQFALDMMAPRFLEITEKSGNLTSYRRRTVPPEEVRISAYGESAKDLFGGETVHQLIAALVDARVLVASAEGLKLAGDELVEEWAKLEDSEVVSDVALVSAASKAWHQARDDENDSLKARGLLWDRYPRLAPVVGLLRKRSIGLTHPEIVFVIESEYRRRETLARDLAAEAKRLAAIDWSLAALLAVEAVEASKVPGLRDLAEPIPAASQALHDVLAATPLSIPVGPVVGPAGSSRSEVRGELLGLRFSDDDKRLEVTLGQTPDAPGGVSVRACDLDDLEGGFGPAQEGATAFENVGLTRLRLGQPTQYNEDERDSTLRPARWPMNEDIVARGALSGSAVELSSKAAPDGAALSLFGHGPPAYFEAFSRDGRWLASASSAGRGSDSCELRLWRLGADPLHSISREPRLLRNVAPGYWEEPDPDEDRAWHRADPAALECFAVTADGRLVASRKALPPCFWDLDGFETTHGVEPAPNQDRWASVLAPGPDGPRLWVVHRQGAERNLVDATGRAESLTVRVSHAGDRLDGLSADGRVIALSDSDEVEAYAYVATAGSYRETRLEPHPEFFRVLPVTVSPDGALLAAQPLESREHSAADHFRSFGLPRLWRTADLAKPVDSDVSDWREVPVFPGPDWAVPTIHSGRFEMPELGREITELSFSPDGRWLVGLARDCEPLFWKIEEDALELTSVFPHPGVTALAFSPDKRSLAFGNDRGETWIVDLELSSLPAGRLGRAHGNAVSALAYDADGGRLAVASGREIHLWTLAARFEDGYEPQVLPLGWSDGSVTQVSFAPGGKRLIAQGAVGQPCAGPGDSVWWPAAQQRLAIFRLDVRELQWLAWANADRRLEEHDWERYMPEDHAEPFVPEDPQAARRFHRGVVMGSDPDGSDPAMRDQLTQRHEPASAGRKEATMSADAVSRITAMLALDGNLLADYLPDPAADDAANEIRRLDFVARYANILTSEEIALMEAGDIGAIFGFLGANLPRPVGHDQGGGGSGS